MNREEMIDRIEYEMRFAILFEQLHDTSEPRDFFVHFPYNSNTNHDAQVADTNEIKNNLEAFGLQVSTGSYSQGTTIQVRLDKPARTQVIDIIDNFDNIFNPPSFILK